MPNAPLNPPPAAVGLVALAASLAATGRGDVSVADTGEPAYANSAAGTITKTATFPVNGAGNQPQITRGAYALVVKAVNGATTVGPIEVRVSDGTAAHDEVVDNIPVISAAGIGAMIVRPFASSLAAGGGAQGTITNVVSLKAIAVVAAGTGATIGLAAAGTP